MPKFIILPLFLCLALSSNASNDFVDASKAYKLEMGDVGISNRDGENRIFHANKQGVRNFNRFIKLAQ